MERLFKDFPLNRLNVGLIADRSRPIILAMYIALADRLGIARDQLRGIVTNNPLADYYCSKTPMFPPQESIRLMVDCIRFCINEVPNFNVCRMNGYNTRELGATAIQEVAFSLAIAKTLLSACTEAGLAVDQFADKITYQFSQGSYFFEDIAKIRAARRIWAKLLKEKFGAQDDRICRMKIHMQTAGSSLTAQEPLNNIVRIALQMLSAALSGTQSMHVASYDEALGIPTEEAVRLAIQTSKIVMHETGVTDVADPLGGSYYVEALTNEIEERSLALVKRIDDLGGAIKAVEDGFFEQQIADSSYAIHNDISHARRVVVGLNRYQESETKKLEYKVFRPNPEASAIAIDRLKRLRKERDQQRAKQCIRQIKAAARGRQALMPIYIEAAHASVTIGEMIQALEEVLGCFQYAAIIAGEAKS